MTLITIDPVKSASILKSQYASAIQAMLDAKAQERSYDNINSGVSYRDDDDATFRAEGAALYAWRSAVWKYAGDQLQAVMAGTRPKPTIAEFLAEIEAQRPFAWPDSPA